jgi:hypothetical protein
MQYKITQSRLLYVMHIDDREHHNLLKVGEVFVDNEEADVVDAQRLARSVRAILDKRSYMQGVDYVLDYVECTTYDQQTKCYKADDIHRTLKMMDVSFKALHKIKDEPVDIWFSCTLDQIRSAITKVKKGHGAGHGEIKFRPEQGKAISDTVAHS